MFAVAPGIYVADSKLVADTGVFGGAAARLKTVVAGANVTVDEDATSVTINAAAAAISASLAAGVNVVLAENEANGQVIIAVLGLTTTQAS